MSGFGVQVRDLTVRYGDTTALDRVSFDIRPGVITGLLGRNGSGKTTALSVLAAFLRKSSGTVLVDGEEPWENAQGRRRRRPGARERRHAARPPGRGAAAHAGPPPGDLRPRPGREAARHVRAGPEEPSGPAVPGKKSAFGVVAGIASRAPLTLLDEVHLGMDAPGALRVLRRPARRLARAPAHDRPVESPDQRDRAAPRGRPAPGSRDRAPAVGRRRAPCRGPDRDRSGHGRRGVRRRPGRRGEATPGRHRAGHGRRCAAGRRAAAPGQHGLELGPVPLQDLFVHLTDHPTEAAR